MFKQQFDDIFVACSMDQYEHVLDKHVCRCIESIDIHAHMYTTRSV